LPIVSDRNYRQLLTDSVAKRSRKIQDIVFKSTPLTRILKDSGRVQTKAAGGPELRIPIEFDRLDTTWFTGYDILPITPKELRNSAMFPWSRIVSMFSLNGTELMYNRGEEEIIDTLAATMSNAEKAIREDWEAALIADGTANGGRQMIGLGGAVPIVTNSGTYGGINRANVPNWRTTYYDVPNGDVSGFTNWDVTTALPIIRQVALARSRGSQYPSLAIADALSFEPIIASMVAHQRIVTPRSGQMGFESLGVWTQAGLVDIVAAGGIGNVMPPNTVFMLDTDNISIYEFPGQSFVPFHPGDGIRPVNQDAFAQGIVWSGQFVVENPLSQVRIKTAS
jgi:hypothetical protein